jgi:hypothetical protein
MCFTACILLILHLLLSIFIRLFVFTKNVLEKIVKILTLSCSQSLPGFETGASRIRGRTSNRDLRGHWGNSEQAYIGRRILSKRQMICSKVSRAVPYVQWTCPSYSDRALDYLTTLLQQQSLRRCILPNVMVRCSYIFWGYRFWHKLWWLLERYSYTTLFGHNITLLNRSI